MCVFKINVSDGRSGGARLTQIINFPTTSFNSHFFTVSLLPDNDGPLLIFYLKELTDEALPGERTLARKIILQNSGILQDTSNWHINNTSIFYEYIEMAAWAGSARETSGLMTTVCRSICFWKIHISASNELAKTNYL